MSMGLGHKYWVQLLGGYKGTLQGCLKYMKDNEPKSNLYWFELRPCIQWSNKEPIKVMEYRVDLVTDGDIKKRNK